MQGFSQSAPIWDGLKRKVPRKEMPKVRKKPQQALRCCLQRRDRERESKEESTTQRQLWLLQGD